MAGNYAAFLHRYYRWQQRGTQLAPTSGSMGYGLPAAVAAKLRHPERTVVCLAGDGCLQMTIQELSTARQHGADIIVIIANNGRYGTIRMHQEKTLPGARVGDGAVQSRLRATGPCLWRHRAQDHGNGSVRPGLRGGAAGVACT